MLFYARKHNRTILAAAARMTTNAMYTQVSKPVDNLAAPADSYGSSYEAVHLLSGQPWDGIPRL